MLAYCQSVSFLQPELDEAIETRGYGHTVLCLNHKATDDMKSVIVMFHIFTLLKARTFATLVCERDKYQADAMLTTRHARYDV